MGSDIHCSTPKNGPKKDLSPASIATIQTIRKEDYSVTMIMKVVKRSRGSVQNAIWKLANKNNSSKTGRPRSFSRRSANAILRAASNDSLTSRALRNRFVPNVSVRTVQLLLHYAAHLGWRGGKRAPRLSPGHLVARKEWAREILGPQGVELVEVVWSDEKRFNLDGTDGFDNYRADMRHEQDVRYSRKNGGGGIMV